MFIIYGCLYDLGENVIKFAADINFNTWYCELSVAAGMTLDP